MCVYKLLTIIKVHNTTSDIGHKPAISNIFNIDNVTSGKNRFPFEARNGLFTGEQ
jgi:hypothetical protein